ncbi:MAG TPA: hypothetical protein VM890_04880 [Longimicrobium sp.]|jgi:hypothetical protein|nr:hypothetical protein [Longimicrobium sp.]
MSSADPVAIHTQDPRSPVDAAFARPTLLSRLATRYVDGWMWYARSGYSPPAPEPGFPLSRPVPVQAACCIDLRGSAAPRFGLLFGTAAGGR